MSKIVLVLAMDESGLVGNNDMPYGLPWHYPLDMKFYRAKTLNKHVVMGRSTYEVIGRALDNRTTYVLSQSGFSCDDAHVISDYQDVFKIDTDEVIISGGVTIYKLFLPYASEIFITKINKTHVGDVYFNDLDLSDFTLVENNICQDGELEFQKWERNENSWSRN